MLVIEVIWIYVEIKAFDVAFVFVGLKKSKNKFKCDECKFSSKEEEQLLNHKKKHDKEYSFKCTFCEKCFHTKTNCDRHIRWMQINYLYLVIQKLQ